MEGELGEVLGDERYKAGIMRAGRDLAEDDLVAPHEHLDAEDAPAAELSDNLAGDAPSLG